MESRSRGWEYKEEVIITDFVCIEDYCFLLQPSLLAIISVRVLQR